LPIGQEQAEVEGFAGLVKWDDEDLIDPRGGQKATNPIGIVIPQLAPASKRIIICVRVAALDGCWCEKMCGTAESTDRPTDDGKTTPNYLIEEPLTETSRREYSVCWEIGTSGAVPDMLSGAAKNGDRDTKSVS